jgi:hypothetical protein
MTFLALTAALSTPARADLTLTSQVTGKAGSGQSVTYLKGGKMRSDSTLQNGKVSTILDVENQKFISLDHAKKQATVVPMAQMREKTAKALQTTKATSTLTPSGESKQIAGRTCEGYVSKVATPMPVGNDTSIMMVITGPVFIAKDAPGSEDYARFYRIAAEKGSILSDPRQSKTPGGPSRGLADLYEEIGKIRGVPYAMELNMKVEGDSPMVAILSKGLSGVMFSSTVTESSSATIPDATFEIPAGYSIKDQ